MPISAETVGRPRPSAKRTDEVDALFSSTVLELCSQISRDSAAVPEHVDFMFIAKYIERMADHATNIAEWAIFIDTGVHPNLNDTQAGK